MEFNGGKVKISPVLKSPKICIIGAGVSGMCAGIQLKRKLGLTSFEIFDTNCDVGGTWLVNTYPGCESDLPAHLYSYSFAPKSDWSATHAAQPEILSYLQTVGRKYDLYKHLHTKKAVKCMTWIQNLNQWKVTVFDLEKKEEQDWFFDIVMSGTGLLRNPEIPELFDSFKGPKMHSAQWDHGLELKGKRVAVVGSGSSAVQIIPSIVGQVKTLISYQRSPAWVLPRPYHKYPAFEKWKFKNVPGFQKLYRWGLFHLQEFSHPVFIPDKLSSHLVRPLLRTVCEVNMRLQVRDKILRERLRPNEEFGCKRPCLSSCYFPALSKSNVEVIRDKIVKVTDHSIITEDGREERVDVLILATGFQSLQYFAPMRIIGRNGKDILEEWISDKPTHYKSITSFDLPNFFNICGPGAEVGHNSLFFVIETQVKWILQIVKEMMIRNSEVFEVKPEVEQNYMRNFQEKLKDKLLIGGAAQEDFYCDPSFAPDLNSDGTNTPAGRRSDNIVKEANLRWLMGCGAGVGKHLELDEFAPWGRIHQAQT